MNYYKFNIGDYAAATAHLSFLEDCAYRRLIDLYYSKEQPIPADIAKACRLVRATSKDERAAVQTVLTEFFTETQDGWTHGRCDADIDAYQQKAESNRVVGKKGGRPKKQTNSDESGNPEITQMVSKNNPQETLTTNQEPLTNNQIQEAYVVIGEDARATSSPADVCKAMKAAGMAAVNPSSPKLANALAAGVTLGELVQAATEAAQQGKGFAYAIAMAEGRRRDALAAPAKQNGKAAEPAWRTEQRNRTLQAVPNIADHGISAQEFFDVEAKNVTAIAMG
jgi:uncharacterized protein YdaU (DUF1376 family)